MVEVFDADRDGHAGLVGVGGGRMAANWSEKEVEIIEPTMQQ